MPPKAKAGQWDAANARAKARREAVSSLNRLAQDVGVKSIKVKADSAAVEKHVRLLDGRCQSGDLPARLRAAVEAYVSNGGRFSVPVSLLPPDDAADGSDAADCGDGGEDGPLSCLSRHRVLDDGFRLESKAFMVTYNSRSFTLDTWPEFLAWVKDQRRRLGFRRWAACLEESAAPGVYHAHAYFWWTDGVGLRRRNTDDLVFAGVRPRVDVCTCQATRSRPLKLAAAHGLWYVAVMKVGTKASRTNFWAWRDYVPRPEWVRSLWEAHKLTHAMFADLSRELRVGFAERKRDLSELEADERRQAVIDHVKSEMERLRGAGVFRPLRDFKEVDAFLQNFKGGAMCRRPILAVIGGTNLGKSILAADVLQRVAKLLGLPDFLEVTVEGDKFLDLTDLDIRQHAGVLLDGVGDVETLKPNREVLQGRPKACKAAKSPTMRFSSVYTLCGRAVVVTFDLSAANLHLFDTDHWLSDTRNVILLKLDAPAWIASGAVPQEVPAQPRDVMASWPVSGVVAFMKSRDMEGPASVLHASGVNGADLLTLDEQLLVRDVHMTPFAARKLLRARDAFLCRC
jgi:hypothetical protein